MNVLTQNGKCRICGIQGRGSEDFICKDCGNPHKIIFTCTTCHIRIDLTHAGPAEREKAFGHKVRLEIGQAIASTSCHKCRNEIKRIRVFQVRPPKTTGPA